MGFATQRQDTHGMLATTYATQAEAWRLSICPHCTGPRCNTSPDTGHSHHHSSKPSSSNRQVGCASAVCYPQSSTTTKTKTLRYNPQISSSWFGPVIIMPFLTLTQKPTYTHTEQERVDLTCSQSDLNYDDTCHHHAPAFRIPQNMYRTSRCSSSPDPTMQCIHTRGS